MVRVGRASWLALVLIAAVIFGVYAGVFCLPSNEENSGPVSKRIVGRKMYGGQSTFIPLRVTTAA